MRVICINNNDLFYITVGKEYLVNSTIKFKNILYYSVVDDMGEKSLYSESRFKVINEKEDDNMKDITIEQKIKNMENEIDKLKDNLEDLKKLREEEKKSAMKKWWKPEVGEDYYTINSMGWVSSYKWNNDSADNSVYKNGNCFQTEGLAEREVFERQLRFKLKKFAYENNEEEIDWNNSKQDKYVIDYDFRYSVLGFDIYSNYKHYNQIYFTSKEVVKNAIETFKDDLIRYFTSDK